MKSRLPLIVAVLLCVAAAAFGAPAFADSSSAPLLLGMAGAAIAPWNRIREPMKPFFNVGASSVAVATIPRYPRTILELMLQLGGTTFAKSDISRIELFLGEKSIWGPLSGTELNDIQRYENGDWQDQSSQYLVIPFIAKNVKEIGGEQIGGIDLTTLPEGDIRLEVELGSGVSAPTLLGHITWGGPQGGGDLGGLMQKFIKRTYAQMASGDQFPPLDLRGAILQRLFFRYTVANAGVSTAAGGGASFANTGNGAMGAITVTARSRAGTFRLRVLETVANAGRFDVYDPDGRIVGAGNVAVAYAGGGLAFTLADGATDFVAGDGFTLGVLPDTTDGNLNFMEIKVNEQVRWSRTCRAARVEQRRYGRFPLSQMYVADFLLDNHADSVIDTSQATSIDCKANLTSADTITQIAQVLARPIAQAS